MKLNFVIKYSKTKRLFLKLFLTAGSLLMLFSLVNLAAVAELINRIRNRFKPKPEIPSDNERTEARLPEEGTQVSVELVLNSRCTSDYDDDPNLFHWGMFDKTHMLSTAQLSQIKNLVVIPRFTDSRIEIRRDKKVFTFVLENKSKEAEKDWVMVESGMQQQALCLVCAAIGIGVLFKNMGKDGTALSNNYQGMVRLKLDAMKPSYGDSYWSDSLPQGRRRWRSGNLPEPLRDGNCPFLETLSALRIENTAGKFADCRAIGQLLWGSRGRTPHRYKSKEWGMTIPTWGGLNELSSVFFYHSDKLYRYVNWVKGRPTHHLEETGGRDNQLSAFFNKIFPAYNGFIILTKNENFNRALWEVGYQLVNILLQASAWDLKYKSVILSYEEKVNFQNTQIKDPVALVAVKTAGY